MAFRCLYLAIFIIIRLKVDPISVNLATQIALVIKVGKISLKVNIIRIDGLIYIFTIESLPLFRFLTLNVIFLLHKFFNLLSGYDFNSINDCVDHFQLLNLCRDNLRGPYPLRWHGDD